MGTYSASQDAVICGDRGGGAIHRRPMLGGLYDTYRSLAAESVA